MAKYSIQKLDLDELKQLQKDVEGAIANFEVRRKNEARAAIEAKAKEFGFELSDLLGAKGNKRIRVTSKYANPDAPSQTWSGRGRRPRWVVDALKAGKTLDDLSI